MTIKFQTMTTATGATALAAGNALLDAIKALVLSHPNWSLVEDTSGIGTAGSRWLAFKLTGASAGLPNDAYVCFAYNPGGWIVAFAGENYNASTHTMTNCCMVFPSSSQALSAAGMVASPPQITASAAGQLSISGSVTVQVQTLVVPSVTTIYWQGGVYDDHLVIGMGQTQAAVATGTAHAGSYNSLVPTPATNDPVRVLFEHIWLSGSTGAQGGFSREVLPLASTTRNYPGGLYARAYGKSSSSVSDCDYGRAQNNTIPDAIQNNYPAAKRLLVSPSTTSGSYTSPAQMSVRGVMNNAIICAGAGAISGITIGDTISYNGTNWAYVGYDMFIDTGA